MTPQTLVNDLVKETCDVRDIILLVVGTYYRSFLDVILIVPHGNDR